MTVADNQIKLSPKKEVDNVKSFDCDVCGKTFKNVRFSAIFLLQCQLASGFQCILQCSNRVVNFTVGEDVQRTSTGSWCK